MGDRDITIAIMAASYSGNKGAAAMMQSSIKQLKQAYGNRLNVYLMSVYPSEDRRQCPHDFVRIVSAKPQQILFVAFPCAVLYRLFGRCAPIRALLLKNNIIKAYKNSVLVVDEAGISFVDSRGFVMNTYSFACVAVPLLLGVPVVKYAQALGPFENWYNRLLAKLALPRVTQIHARGQFTYEYLAGLGIRKNVKLCADGVFSMPPDGDVAKRVQKECEKIGFSHMVGLSVSSVVERRCKKAGIDYCGIMAGFIQYLTAQGYRVFMFANAARIGSKRPRNNDLMTGDAICRAYQKATGSKQGLVWEHREMDAEEIFEYIGHLELLVASRFHAMVFALKKQVPVMLIGWSHKYQEVMDQFGLGAYAADYEDLSLEGLQESFERFAGDREKIREQISGHLPGVVESSRQNVQDIRTILDEIYAAPQKYAASQKYATPQRFAAKPLAASGVCRKDPQKNTTKRGRTLDRKSRYMNHVVNLDAPQRYIGAHRSCVMGYAADAGIRANAASGGMVTALLCYLLDSHIIDGAWVVKTAFTKDGRLTYETYVATTAQQIRDASSSVYMKIPMLAHLEKLRQFDGRLAVVLTPCMMQAFVRILDQDEALRNKVVLKIGLFCSGCHDVRASEYALDKCRVKRDLAQRLYYRRGHWRGMASVVYQDGSQKNFSYKKTICAYKNAYFFIEPRCLRCKDQFAAAADISFGDVWLPEMKKEPLKYTGCVVRSKKAQEYLLGAQAQGALYMRHMSGAQMLRSQMRALTFKFRGSRWNHKLAGWIAVQNQKFSVEHPLWLKRVPMPLVYYYMCFIRLLLSF